MDENFELHEISFIWNQEKAKAKANVAKHSTSFEQAAEAFFDPFIKIIDVSRNKEARDAVLGMDKRWNLLFVVHIVLEENQIRIISARKATHKERQSYEN